MDIFGQGFILQASLILALGAQNLFVLESGLKKRRHFLVALTCSVCDLTLVLLGVLGAASIFVRIYWLKVLIGSLGVLFLLYYALQKIQEYYRDDVRDKEKVQLTEGTKSVLLAALAFSLLNPHVYLDTVILIGGYATKFPDVYSRLIFGLGASAFSTVWFFGLAFLASTAQRLLNNPKAMRRVALVSGLILLFIAFKLGVEVWGWFVAGA